MTGQEPGPRSKPPVVTLVVLVLAVLVATAAACVGVVTGEWTPLGVALVASLGAAVAGLVVDALRGAGR